MCFISAMIWINSDVFAYEYKIPLLRNQILFVHIFNLAVTDSTKMPIDHGVVPAWSYNPSSLKNSCRLFSSWFCIDLSVWASVSATDVSSDSITLV